MVQLTANVYDNGGVGDSNLTQETQFVGGGAPDRVSQFFFDWRDRQVASKSGVQSSEDNTTHRPITFTTYDNLNEAILVQQYDGDGVTINTINGDPQAPVASLLRAQTAYAYDDQGRIFQTQVYNVDPSNGALSANALTTNYYFDLRGNQIAESAPGGLWTKDVFDGADRLVTEYTTDGGSGTTWADASMVANDTVLEQTETFYDGDSNAIETIDRQRFDDATGTGPLGDPTTNVQARVYYSGAYFDAADRLVASVDVGTNGGTPWIRPTTVPDRSDTVLVTAYGYNPAGWVQDTVDPRGIDTRTLYDALGRATETIVAYTDGVPTNDTNQTTAYTYDGDNNTLTVTAVLPGGAVQTTQYVYGVTTTSGSTVNSNDVLSATIYPDPTTGQPSTDPRQRETYTRNAQGQIQTMTDRNGTTHTYTYDVLGRETADIITTLGAGVDGSVRRIETAYDTQGNAYLFTSYDAPVGGNIVNQVLRQFNGLGQLTAEYQSTAGPVNLTTTPAVRYAYTEMGGGANNSRLVSMTYPSGYVLNFNYGSPGSLNERISRLDSLSDNTGILEAYKYLGLSTVVERDHPQSGLNLTYISQTNSTGDAGDKYTGLDRFGRIVEQAWIDTLSGTTVEDLTYAHDRDSNVTAKNNLLNTAFSEQYTYNSLNELTAFTRNDGESQSWNIDATGNFNSVTTNGMAQDRTSNAQNELTGVGSNSLTYDNNGNMTTDQNGNTLVYDAWNRLVEVKDSNGNTLIAYSYDALDRRITEDRSGTVNTLYYSSQWQVVEEQVSGVTTLRYVWSPAYVDGMVLRDQLDSDGSLNQRLYAVQDANWNVTALVDVNGNIVERNVYSPYGVATVYDANWNERTSGSQFAWVYLYQGDRFEALTGLYDSRMRVYSPTLMRFLSNDPLMFASGQFNVVIFGSDNPVNGRDPFGLLETGKTSSAVKEEIKENSTLLSGCAEGS